MKLLEENYISRDKIEAKIPIFVESTTNAAKRTVARCLKVAVKAKAYPWAVVEVHEASNLLGRHSYMESVLSVGKDLFTF